MFDFEIGSNQLRILNDQYTVELAAIERLRNGFRRSTAQFKPSLTNTVCG